MLWATLSACGYYTSEASLRPGAPINVAQSLNIYYGSSLVDIKYSDTQYST